MEHGALATIRYVRKNMKLYIALIVLLRERTKCLFGITTPGNYLKYIMATYGSI